MSSFTNNLKKIAFVVSLLTSLNIIGQQGEVTINQDKEIDALLELKKDIEVSSDRFKIQIFFGSRRGFAENARAKFNNKYPNIPSSLVYEEPNFKIWVGNFRSYLEAERALIDIKKTFPNAIVFEPKQKY